ncbi:MAPEG family protein [Saccharospirillum impatiens]|uniref:MAPEG family protein n=1 Tax=Saccharospirillum impatiens TaxID=169438 RepID=UPI00040422B2|nr:MAPEG family protein [Saccharospirillum impatiens]
MSLPLWCLFIAALLVIMSKWPAMKVMAAMKGGYDNNHPRAQQANLTGAGARGIAAHQNTIEAFPMFAAGVIVAEVFAAGSMVASLLAMAFIVSRVVYIGLYVGNVASLRSIVWAVGYLASLGLLLAPVYGA